MCRKSPAAIFLPHIFANYNTVADRKSATSQAWTLSTEYSAAVFCAQKWTGKSRRAHTLRLCMGNFHTEREGSGVVLRCGFQRICCIAGCSGPRWRIGGTISAAREISGRKPGYSFTWKPWQP